MMSMKKGILFLGLLFAFGGIILAGPALAGEGTPPPGTIVGPEIWGVVVINHQTNAVTLRVKRIVNCNVETHGAVQATFNGWPTDATSVLYYQLSGITLFPDQPQNTTPIITKVKNFAIEGDIASFDAQIKFLQ